MSTHLSLTFRIDPAHGWLDVDRNHIAPVFRQMRDKMCYRVDGKLIAATSRKTVNIFKGGEFHSILISSLYPVESNVMQT